MCNLFCNRYIANDGVLRPYDKEKSEGKALLYQLDDGEHSDEEYVFHEKSNDPKTKAVNIFLVTNSHAYYIDGTNTHRALWSLALKGTFTSFELLFRVFGVFWHI